MTNNLEIAKKLFLASLEFQQNGDLVRAIKSLEEAYDLYPSRESIINNLIILYFSTDDTERLSNLLHKLENDGNVKHKQLGHLYLEFLNNNFQNCINLSHSFLATNPGLEIQIIDILIKAYFRVGDISNMLIYSRKYLQNKSNYNQKLFAIGNAMLCLSKPRAAKWYIEKSLKLNFDRNYALDLGFCYLQLKDFKNGFNFLEKRFEGYHSKIQLFKETPQLENLNNIQQKKIVVWYEQGIGDTLQFARYIKLLKKYQPNITFVIQNKLLDLFKEFDADIDIVSYDDVKTEKFDFQTSLLNLIPLLNSSYEQIPYEKLKFNFSLTNSSNIFKVGFAHSGNAGYSRDLYRSIQSNIFEELFTLPNIKFFKLNSKFEDYIEKYENIFDYGHLSIYEISQKLAEFDLVITTDTFLVHLCGSLNVKCILLLNYNSDWRWFDDRRHTKWYPSVRIMKQNKILEWKPIIKTLMRFLKKKSNIFIK